MSEEKSLNFIEEIIEKDLADGKYTSIVTRFPPEPNGYLHIGHATSINLNFGLAKKYGGYTNLRFDDTNPVTEETEYVESIKEDVRWLGFEWKHEYFASDYFEQLYAFALKLIEKGLAYVDDSTPEQIAAQKGTPTEPGSNSVYRDRSVAENTELFQNMRAGLYPDGSRVLRAKTDMASPNMIMRDPVLYRIKHAHHHRTGDQWCLYPMYDMAHPPSDSLEEVTHSLCTMEFVPHRELYDWLLLHLQTFPSHQYEFARRNLSYTVMSKRKLLQLVQEGHVESWDDPRMPTISGMRRRGYTPEAINDFCERIGVAKRDNMVDVGLLEFCVREHLNKIALRRMVVFDPLKVIITNYPGGIEMLKGEGNADDENSSDRDLPFGREIFIEQEDFMEVPPKKFFRLFPGGMVRLKNAYIIKCDEVIKNENGEIAALHCSYIPESKSGHDTSGINVKGTLHWVEVSHAITAEVRLYDRLFKVEDPSSEAGDFKEYINNQSLQTIAAAYAEPALQTAKLNERYQFLRKGYFTLDNKDTNGRLVFNRTVTLKDAWAREQRKS